MRIMPRATYSLRRLRSLFDSNTTIFLTSVTVAKGPALSLSDSLPLRLKAPLRLPPHPSHSRTPVPETRTSPRLPRCPASMHPGNALRHRDIPKRYILTFLKRDGNIRSYAPSENRSHIQNLARQ